MPVRLLIRISLFTILFSAFGAHASDGPKDKAKLFAAKQEYLGGRYQAALDIYKELYDKKTEDPALAYYVGECYFAMGLYTHSLEFFEKAKTLNYKGNPELNLYLGRVYHISGSLDKALEEFNTFRGSVGSLQKVSDSRVDYYIAQCKTAKDLMAKPVNVKIENMGDAVNSAFDDKSPLLSRDGKSLYFTTRRPAGKLTELV